MPSFVTPADSFGAREIAKAAPADAHVVKAFNTHFSHVLAAGRFDGLPWTCCSPATTRRQRPVSLRSSTASGWARWTPVHC